MNPNDALLWTHQPQKRVPKPDETLFEFVRSDHVRVRVELRDHGALGCEVQVFHNEEILYGFRHPTRRSRLRGRHHASARI